MDINEFMQTYGLNGRHSIEAVIEQLYAANNMQFRSDLKTLVVKHLKQPFTTCNCPQKAVDAVKRLRKYQQVN